MNDVSAWLFEASPDRLKALFGQHFMSEPHYDDFFWSRLYWASRLVLVGPASPVPPVCRRPGKNPAVPAGPGQKDIFGDYRIAGG